MRRALLLLPLLAASLAACSRSDAPTGGTQGHSGMTVRDVGASIAMDTGSTRLVLWREPLTFIFTDGEGNVAAMSQQVDALPVPIAAIAEPAPLGAELPKSLTDYSSPLGFIVGAQQEPQIPAGPWEANVLMGATAGVAYQATKIVETQHVGSDRVEVTAATSDPTGRVLHITVVPAGNGGLRVSVRPDPDTGVAVMTASLWADPDEPFRGFGGRHNALDQRGNDFLGWVQQQNTGAGMLQPVADPIPGGGSQYLFPNGPTAAYYVSPSFVTRRYGFLLERDEMSRWRMASDSVQDWQVQVAAPALDYSFVTGAPARSIPALNALTGRHRAPPDWVTGVILDRSTIPFTQNAAQYADQVRADLAKIDELHLHISGYRVEGWFELAPELRQELAAEFHRRGIKVLAYFRSFISADAAGTEDPAVFTDALTHGYVTTTPGGAPFLFGGNFFGASALIDFTNEAALAWWKGRIQAALDEGVDGFMQDFGEQTLALMQFADGRDGAALHNRYSVLYHRATREAIDEWRATHPGHEDIWFFTRAGYGGLDGAARYEGANFAGDGNTDFSESSGLAAQTPDMLNRGLAGAFGFTTDIGGYFDFVTPATTKELLIRWAEWAVLSPVMRLHGSANAGTHMPWNYDDETVAIWKSLSELRYRAQPYVRRTWHEAEATGIPIARPLWLAFPDDAAAGEQKQEWMLGDDVLVAPVVTAGATSRAVYFPAGCWQHGETGAQFTGPASQDVPAPLASLPWFHRCGSSPF